MRNGLFTNIKIIKTVSSTVSMTKTVNAIAMPPSLHINVLVLFIAMTLRVLRQLAFAANVIIELLRIFALEVIARKNAVHV